MLRSKLLHFVMRGEGGGMGDARSRLGVTVEDLEREDTCVQDSMHHDDRFNHLPEIIQNTISSMSSMLLLNFTIVVLLRKLQFI